VSFSVLGESDIAVPFRSGCSATKVQTACVGTALCLPVTNRIFTAIAAES
jgi:hypothetical protein